MAASKKSTAKKKAAASAPTAKKKAPAKMSAVNKAGVNQATAKKATRKTAAKNTVAKQSATKSVSTTKKPKSPFSAAFLRKQEAALMVERERYSRNAENLQAEAEQLARDREPGDVQFDEESGEGDGIAVERERDLALSAQARDAIDEIDAALARIKDGTYGISVMSGLPIPEERLEAIPHASMRVDEKTRGMTWR